MRQYLLKALFTSDDFLVSDQVPYVWLALTKTVPVADSAGDQLNEPVGGNYYRVVIPLNSSAWGLNGYYEMTNLYSVTMPVPSADWGSLNGWALVDAQNSGQSLITGNLLQSLRVPVGQTAVLPQGLLTFSLDE